MLTESHKDILQEPHVQKATTFRNFQAQVLRREIHILDNRKDVFHKVGLFQLRIRQVYVHDKARITSEELFGIDQRRPQNPLTQFREQVVLFQHIHELHRRHHAIFIIFPTDKRFCPDNLFGCRIDNRLVTEEESFAVVHNAVTNHVDTFDGKAFIVTHIVLQNKEFAQMVILRFIISESQARIHRFRRNVQTI